MSDSDSTSTPQRPDHQDYHGEPLDERLYDLTDEESRFFKQQTGIQDDDELKAHILELQAEAYKVHPYPCIRGFWFVKFKLSRLFGYQDLLKIGNQPNGPIFLDIGSGLGNNARKAVADGYPLENVVTSDLHQEFADLGHKLFKTTKETYPITFIPGDVFDPKHLQVVAPFTTTNAPTGPTPELGSLTSLNLLHGRVAAVHASSFFHLFSEEQQLHLAHGLAGLLSPEPGSIIFGIQPGLVEKGFTPSVPGRHHGRLCHSPASWAELWDGLVFEKGVVKVKTMLVQVERKGFEGDEANAQPATLLVWSVTRL